MEDELWTEFQDEQGNFYYYNSETGETSWERSAYQGNEKHRLVEITDINGGSDVYWNEIAKESQWTQSNDFPSMQNSSDAVAEVSVEMNNQPAFQYETKQEEIHSMPTKINGIELSDSNSDSDDEEFTKLVVRQIQGSLGATNNENEIVTSKASSTVISSTHSSKLEDQEYSVCNVPDNVSIAHPIDKLFLLPLSDDKNQTTTILSTEDAKLRCPLEKETTHQQIASSSDAVVPPALASASPSKQNLNTNKNPNGMYQNEQTEKQNPLEAFLEFESRQQAATTNTKSQCTPRMECTQNCTTGWQDVKIPINELSSHPSPSKQIHESLLPGLPIGLMFEQRANTLQSPMQEPHLLTTTEPISLPDDGKILMEMNVSKKLTLPTEPPSPVPLQEEHPSWIAATNIHIHRVTNELEEATKDRKDVGEIEKDDPCTRPRDQKRQSRCLGGKSIGLEKKNSSLPVINPDGKQRDHLVEKERSFVQVNTKAMGALDKSLELHLQETRGPRKNPLKASIPSAIDTKDLVDNQAILLGSINNPIQNQLNQTSLLRTMDKQGTMPHASKVDCTRNPSNETSPRLRPFYVSPHGTLFPKASIIKRRDTSQEPCTHVAMLAVNETSPSPLWHVHHERDKINVAPKEIGVQTSKNDENFRKWCRKKELEDMKNPNVNAKARLLEDNKIQEERTRWNERRRQELEAKQRRVQRRQAYIQTTRRRHEMEHSRRANDLIEERLQRQVDKIVTKYDSENKIMQRSAYLSTLQHQLAEEKYEQWMAQKKLKDKSVRIRRRGVRKLPSLNV